MKRLTMLVLSLMVLGSAGSAMAADDAMKVEKPIRFLVGGFSPSNGGGGTRTSVGLGYDFMKSAATNPSVFGFYVDHNTKKNAGVTTSLTGVGVSGRFYLVSANKAGKPYASFGVGSYTLKAGTSTSKLGGKAELGYELNNGYFGSVDYTATQKISGSNVGGVNFRVGYRF